MTPTHNTTHFLGQNPLVPATALFLLGVACGRWCEGAGTFLVMMVVAAWLLWLVCEILEKRFLAHVGLAVALLSGGMALWVLNQAHIEHNHVAHFLPARGETLVALRAEVSVPPDVAETHGNRHFLARAHEVWTDRGWLRASGEMLVNWSGETPASVRRGEVVELYGWLSRPTEATNPGAYDPRERLAADRVFVQVRVPHADGVVVLDASGAAGEDVLSRFRIFLREKMLEHTVRENVPAAYTLTALLLGYRDPAISDVSQAFADAGVAHLLAISGSHIVFFTGLVWLVLRFVPMRPRWREVVIAGVVGLYVLATPCGPPIVRAAVALLIVLLARLLGRPRQYLNMLCAAAVIVVLMRPTDIGDAGFQLSFVTAAGLILLARRVHAAMFGAWLAREALVAELSRRRWEFWKLRAYRFLAAALVANLIGALTASPLVAYHFGQVNTWAPVTGLVALPMVSVAMIVAAVQLIGELVGLGALLAPLSALVGKAMIWLVAHLAALPGAAIALRAPPIWAVAAIYAALLLWMMRRQLGISRAGIVNVSLAAMVATVAWYAFTAPVGVLRITALDAGGGSCVMLRTPRGEVWVIDAGTGQTGGGSVVASALRPAMRVAGTRRLDGFIVSALDASHAREAGDVIAMQRPRQVWVSAPAWKVRGQTLAGAGIADAASESQAKVRTLSRGQRLDLGEGCTLEALWPFTGDETRGGPGLVLACEFDGRRVLIADPAAIDVLPMAAGEQRFDAIILTGPPAGDFTGLWPLIAGMPAGNVAWCGHGVWAKELPQRGERNTDEGAVMIEVMGDGRMQVGQ